MNLRLATLFLLPAAARAADTNALSLLAPAYGEMPMPFWEHYGLAISVAGLAFLLVAGLLAWLMLLPTPPLVPAPEAVARAALAKLQGRPETGAALSELSQILRRYIGTAFKLSAGEPTTTEFLALISHHEKIGPELAQKLADFMRECDERKFSTAVATTPLDGVNRAQQLIALAEQRRRQPTPAPATAAAPQPAPR